VSSKDVSIEFVRRTDLDVEKMALLLLNLVRGMDDEELKRLARRASEDSNRARGSEPSE
jgi:hypothetical protein